MTELDDIRAIVEVINQGGFSAAARQLGIAKSIVSRRVSRLEADLGTRLLNRTARGVTATEAGTEFKVRGERILRELAEAREAVASQRHELVGRLRLSLPLSFGLRHLAPILGEWASMHPRLEIDAVYSDRQVDLVGEGFDAAVRIGLLKDSSLISRQVAATRLVAVASPAYLAVHPVPLHPGDLAIHECLIYSGSRERMTWRFDVGGSELAIIPAGRFLADSGEALLQAVEAGLGVTVLPMFLVSQSLTHGRLVELLPSFALPTEGIHVLRPQSAYVSARLRALIDLLVERFSGIAPWDMP